MTDPINMIETLLKSGEMELERNDLARWTFGNTSLAMNGSGLKKPVKQTKGKRVIRTKRIDHMVALFLAMQRARFYAFQVDVNEQIKAEGWGDVMTVDSGNAKGKRPVSKKEVKSKRPTLFNPPPLEGGNPAREQILGGGD